MKRPVAGSSQTSLSIVLPAYNEEANIKRAVDKAIETGSRLADPFEVIVVDDGSKDRTGAVVQEMIRKDPTHIRLLTHKPNQGYGAALRSGFEHARYNLVFFTDSDNQFDISELEYFIPLMSDYEMVTGFRVYRYDTVMRCILSWIYNRIVGILFRLRVRDVDCAFKLMRREVVQQVSIDCENFFVNTELLAKARKWNFRIAEKGVRHYPRMAGETTVRASDIPRTLATIFRMWRRIYFPSRKEMDRQLGAREAREDVTEFIPARH